MGTCTKASSRMIRSGFAETIWAFMVVWGPHFS
jgi:hypothetical protein